VGFGLDLLGRVRPGPTMASASVTLKLSASASAGVDDDLLDLRAGDAGVGVADQEVVLEGDQHLVGAAGHAGERERRR
jgi:hypothetical protein